jgi:hypothetical protein
MNPIHTLASYFFKEVPPLIPHKRKGEGIFK